MKIIIIIKNIRNLAIIYKSVLKEYLDLYIDIITTIMIYKFKLYIQTYIFLLFIIL